MPYVEGAYYGVRQTLDPDYETEPDEAERLAPYYDIRILLTSC